MQALARPAPRRRVLQSAKPRPFLSSDFLPYRRPRSSEARRAARARAAAGRSARSRRPGDWVGGLRAPGNPTCVWVGWWAGGRKVRAVYPRQHACARTTACRPRRPVLALLRGAACALLHPGAPREEGRRRRAQGCALTAPQEEFSRWEGGAGGEAAQLRLRAASDAARGGLFSQQRGRCDRSGARTEAAVRRGRAVVGRWRQKHHKVHLLEGRRAVLLAPWRGPVHVV